MYTRMHMHTCTYTHMHAHIRKYTYMHTCPLTDVQTCIHEHTHTRKHIHAHTCTDVQTYTHVNTYTHTYTHTHTHGRCITCTVTGAPSPGDRRFPAPLSFLGAAMVCVVRGWRPLSVARGCPEEKEVESSHTVLGVHLGGMPIAIAHVSLRLPPCG